MDRRQFIKNAALSSVLLAGAGLGTSCFGKSGGKGENIRWSMGWILWRDFKDKKIPLAEAIQNMSYLGLDGVEFTPRKEELAKQGFTRESFRDLLAEKKLSVAGNYFGRNFQDATQKDQIISDFKDTLNNLKFYGAKTVVIGPPGRKGDINESIRSMAPMLNELGKIANGSGMQTCLHPHVNTLVETPEEIDLIMELTDPKYVLMAPDTGHIQLGGGNVVEIVHKYSDRLGYFHLKDTTGKFERPSFGPNLRELGKGEVDFKGVMKILKEIKYSGWLNVEQDHTFITPFESAKESMNFITTTLKPIYT